MIAHVSIPSARPRETALLLAEIIAGQAFSFPVVPGAWIAVASDGSGTAIEVYPDGMAHHPGTGDPDPSLPPQGPSMMPWEDQIFEEGTQLRPSAFHLAVTTTLSDDRVIEIANAAGCRTVACDRAGVFKLIEVWLDEVTLVEVLNAEETARYLGFMNPAGCAAMFGPGFVPAQAA